MIPLDVIVAEADKTGGELIVEGEGMTMTEDRPRTDNLFETETVDGRERIWFPSISYHWVDTGRLTKYPPPNEIKFNIIYHDLVNAEKVEKIGLTRDPRHTGRSPVPLVDRRNAPQ